MKAGSYKYQLWEKAQKEQQCCFDWLLKFVRDGEPYAFTRIKWLLNMISAAIPDLR